MTVDNSNNRIDHDPDGIVSTFVYDFRVDEADHLVVYADGEKVTEGYTVLGVGDEEGDVSFDVAPSADINTLTFIREVPSTQETAYPVLGPFPAQSHEAALDKLTFLIQQLEERFERVLSFPVDVYTGEPLSLPTPQAGYYMRWLGDLSGLENAPFTSAQPQNDSLTVTMLANVADTLSDGDWRYTLGRSSPGDGGHGPWIWSSGNNKSLCDSDPYHSISIPLAGDDGTNGAWLRLIFNNVYMFPWFGPPLDGVSDVKAVLQSAVDFIPEGSTLDLGDGYTYKISRTAGTYEDYGVYIDRPIKLTGKSTIERYDSIVTTGYFPLFLGNPESVDPGDITPDVIVEGVYFNGSETRHTSDGDAANDWRYMIGVRNVEDARIERCKFTGLDSGCIYIQGPYMYTGYHEYPKSYGIEILNNRFIGTPHTTYKRAIVHAIVSLAVDSMKVKGNYFKWVDDCLAPFGTFQYPDQVESDTYSYGGNDIIRGGRGLEVTHNVAINTSEHFCYILQTDFEICNNIIWTDTPTVCVGNIKFIRGYGLVSGNLSTTGTVGVDCHNTAEHVTISGNKFTILSCGDDSKIHNGVGIDTQSITASYFSTFTFLAAAGVSNIKIFGNLFKMPDVVGTNDYVNAVRMTTPLSSPAVSFTVEDIDIRGNIIANYKNGIHAINPYIRNVRIKGNAFKARSFTEAGFTTATAMNTYAPLVVRYNSNVLLTFEFSGNTVFGAEYLVASDTGGGSALNLPVNMQGNKLDYIQYFDTADFDSVKAYTNFKNNTGVYFLGRSWAGWGYGNSLSSTGYGGLTERRYNFFFDGTNMRFYTDDAGSFISF